jgi:hypothetical protein
VVAAGRGGDAQASLRSGRRIAHCSHHLPAVR